MTEPTSNSFDKAVLFDLDGVLMDTQDAMRRAILGTATAALGRRIEAAALKSEYERLPHYEVLSRLGVHDRGVALGASWETALAVAAQDVVPFDGALEVLQDLASRDVAVGVVTMQPRSRLAWLVPAELRARFQVVIGWGDAEPKPSGAGVTLALERLKVHPSRACFIGDSPGDVAAAAAAGVTSVGAAWGYTGTALADCRPGLMLDTLSQVPKAVAELLG